MNLFQRAAVLTTVQQRTTGLATAISGFALTAEIIATTSSSAAIVTTARTNAIAHRQPERRSRSPTPHTLPDIDPVNVLLAKSAAFIGIACIAAFIVGFLTGGLGR